jgi:tetratricopeptide (TPR) repeat protein
VGIHKLARLLQDQGDLAGARSLYTRALAINEKALGQEHPDTAAGLNNLADVFRAQGDFTGARPLMERALAIYDKAFGPEHPNTNRVRYNFARLLSSMGQTDEALAHSQAALAGHKKVLGQNHHWTKDSVSLAARLLFRHALGSVSRPSDEVLVGRSENMGRVVEGTDGPPNSPPPLNEAKRARIISRSGTKKARQKMQAAPAPEPTPNHPIAKAEAGRIVDGTDARPNSLPPSSTTTAKEVGNEANRSRIIARLQD